MDTPTVVTVVASVVVSGAAVDAVVLSVVPTGAAVVGTVID